MVMSSDVSSDDGGVGSDEGGVSSDGEEVLDLAGCSWAMYKKRDGEHGVWFRLDTGQEEEEEGEA